MTANATTTTLLRGAAVLATTPTGWRSGEVLRVEVLWNRVRVYRNAILVLDVEDPTDPGAGRQAGLYASGDGRITAWAGGELRQEYTGAVLDMGDVKSVLGEPVRFDLAISNLAPMGGADRFAALLRHGLNTSGTYDLDRGTVKVYSALRGAEVPVLVGSGLIEGPVELAEDRARIAVRGRDGFLTPKLDPGSVTYLAGPPPVTAPLPSDPCAPSPSPVVIPGGPSPEPDDDDEDDDGEGYEAPDEPAAPPDPLMGQFIVSFGYAGFGTDGQELVYGTDVKEYRNRDPLDPEAGGLPPGRGSVPVWDRRQLDRDPDHGDEQDGQPPKDLDDLPPWTPGQPIPAGTGAWVNTFTDEHGVEYTTTSQCVCGNCDAPVIPDPPAGHTYLGSCFAGGCGVGPTPGSRCDPDASVLARRARAPSVRASESRPYARHYRWLYRGPDVEGTHLSRDPGDESTQSLLFEEWWTIASIDYDNSAGTYATLDIKLARYDASGIHSTADLAAIHPLRPPARIETLATWAINGTTLSAKTLSVFLAKALALNALPLSLTKGPELIGIELPSTGWSRGAVPHSEIAVWPTVNAATRLLKIRAL